MTFLSGKFIMATDELSDLYRHIPAPYFRKAFNIDFTAEEAEITITGLGFYELYINGKNITKGALAPYISNPDDIIYYDRYDLREYLVSGENVIGILLGNGFRNNVGGRAWSLDAYPCRGPLCTALNVCIKGDGKEINFEADETFKTHSSPVLWNDERLGYRIDTRLELDGWCKSGFDDSDWTPALKCQPPRGDKTLCEAEPIAVRQRIRPVEIKHFDRLPFARENNLKFAEPLEETFRDDVYVYDFGVNTAGVTELHINGKPGQVVSVRHGEWNQNGNFSISTTIHYGDALPSQLEYSQRDVFTLKGGEETLTPRFKYDGFRYAYVEGLTPEQATEDALTLLEMSSDLPERGSFRCSDERLNKLFEMTRRSDLANFYYFPTDCPHREKNGWTGDIAVSAEHMLMTLHAEKSLRTWMDSVRHAQRLDGALPSIIPTSGWGFEWGNGPMWDSAAVMVPYYLYKYQGDKTVIEENAQLILRYVSHVMTKRDERGLVAYGLGDWEDPDWEMDENKIKAPLVVTDSLTVFDILKKSEFMFAEIGRRQESVMCHSYATEIGMAIRRHLIDRKTMMMLGDCQTCQAYAISIGFFRNDEKLSAAKSLLRILERDNYENRCGMIGCRHLFRALDIIGRNDLAYRIMLSENRTGYGSWLKEGATSLFENFPYPEDGRDTCSHNHHFLGDIAAWMMMCMAGLRYNVSAKKPREVKIAPTFIEGMEFAEAYHETVYGTVAVKWQRDGDDYKLSVTVPEGMTASVARIAGYRLSAGTGLLHSGEHNLKFIKNTHGRKAYI